MRSLRHHRWLAQFVILAMAWGLFAPLAAQAAPILLDPGICHAPSDDGGSAPPGHDPHGGCCVLCHASALGTALPVALPLPRGGVVIAVSEAAATLAPAASAPAYAARAPPAHS